MNINLHVRAGIGGGTNTAKEIYAVLRARHHVQCYSVNRQDVMPARSFLPWSIWLPRCYSYPAWLIKNGDIDLYPQSLFCAIHPTRTSVIYDHGHLVHYEYDKAADDRADVIRIAGRRAIKWIERRHVAQHALPRVHVIANSHISADMLRRAYGKEAAAVIYPPVDIDYYSEAVPHPRQGVITVGTVKPNKRQDVICAAAARARAKCMVMGYAGRVPKQNGGLWVCYGTWAPRCPAIRAGRGCAVRCGAARRMCMRRLNHLELVWLRASRLAAFR